MRLTKHHLVFSIRFPHLPLARALLPLIKWLDKPTIPILSLLPHLPLSLLSLQVQPHHLYLYILITSLYLLNMANQTILSVIPAEWTKTRTDIIRWNITTMMRISWASLRKMDNCSESITQSIMSTLIWFSHYKVVGLMVDR